jgi:hypothetical protein
MPVARQQISNTHQWTDLEGVFATRSMRQLRDATVEVVFSMWSMTMCYKQDKS